MRLVNTLAKRVKIESWTETHLNEYFSISIVSRELVNTALKRTRAGTCNMQTCSAYAEPISIDKAILPFIANEMAF